MVSVLLKLDRVERAKTLRNIRDRGEEVIRQTRGEICGWGKTGLERGV